MSGRPLRTETAAIFCLRSTSRSYEHVSRSTGYLGSLGAATRIRAVLRRTQLECDLGGSRVLIGTQEVAEPVYSGALRPPTLLRGNAGLLDARAVPERPLRLYVQDVGVDRGRCQKFGNETYCD